MSPSAPEPDPLVRRLLEAQVRFNLERLSKEELAATMAGLATDVLASARAHPLDDLVDRDVATRLVVEALRTAPGSTAAKGVVEVTTEVLHTGPDEPYPLGEIVRRDQVEALLDALLGLNPALERALERLTASPLVGTMAARFMGRIVGEVLQANKAVTDRVPGLSSLMSFGTSAASRVMGAADKQFEGLIGDSLGKGGSFAVRRLNKIVIETLRDPTTREAVLQVWDLLAREPVAGLGRYATREEISGVVGAAYDLAGTTAAHERVGKLAEAVVEAFFDRYGDQTPDELLEP